MTVPLFVVPTPIGNLKDITFRALDTIKTADVLLCEDTRRTMKLLNYYDIKVKMLSYHEHNERNRTKEVLDMLSKGLKVALTSDAGTPCISDPGYILVSEAIKAGFEVDALPGPSAILPALIMSGLPMDRFFFLGFLPDKRGPRRKFLASLKKLAFTSIFYVAPHKLKRDLSDILGVWGDRQAALIREISKLHQECRRNLLSELLKEAEGIKGELTLVVDGSQDVSQKEEDDSWQKVATHLRNCGMPLKDVAKTLSESYGIKKNLVRKFVLDQERLERLEEEKDES
ncbi:MAG TPA: 16S rRNA (cytidine(1402)-2'-O)-methyltransferase [Acetomicrobium sp.]|jgi:16S rRNA (cytidine1402-2'-O)-methyltransferase|uniref:16S rRNA (cytidine(1402)-2'-O)-methyltransferase n=1 Tax=Acetomicrobium TaxID=49894 RepID=UPI0026F1CFE6|nr:16S rRNA (cytidine(1402)-2'-O)-methyltransferase [Acetomicrobium mobile]MDI9376775.1 16S rRNA (cytidine(1402)-2'-O)-methyltransferase [Synergistota bacterium]HOB10710.1 16S rRNA (cytidine(1402)-2'-O)-methyltransferase [Acetomicrobium sp.]HQA36921.1 16S rRNA (cytidine(1402)-2'-O)-methyltransferase [Acetomicrobium sp.]HQC87983.1 16S rRNA (cytidine(1402)-2'-O)-methyltransferase [Acetomicrobium sp.]